ncbi:MAG: ROK family protein [Bdellovibrionaceae bacterium]|nr:ROK family protein [Pseudobdellovibrionaceae bacterium]
MTKSYSIGLDLGGTKLACALVDHTGQILAFQKESILSLKVDPKTGPTKIVGVMGEMVAGMKKRFPECFKKGVFRGVGLASAGPLNVELGEITHAANFPGWKRVKIQRLLEDEMRRRRICDRVEFQNDAIAASRAEGWIGGAQGLRSFAVVTIGTGIGTGVIFRGHPLQDRGMGSELGHLILNSMNIKTAKDLDHHTVEGVASGTGILRRARTELGLKVASVEELVDLAEAQPLFDDAADALAALCYNLSIGFNLEKILFSGGLIKVRHLYWNRLKARYKALITEFNPEFGCPLVVAKAMNQAGVIGAARLPYHTETDVKPAPKKGAPGKKAATLTKKKKPASPRRRAARNAASGRQLEMSGLS